MFNNYNSCILSSTLSFREQSALLLFINIIMYSILDDKFAQS